MSNRSSAFYSTSSAVSSSTPSEYVSPFDHYDRRQDGKTLQVFSEENTKRSYVFIKEEKNMTKIELLFREYRRDERIHFEEFQHAGWSISEYLTYLRLCENLRATTICLRKLHHKLKMPQEELSKLKKSLFEAELKSFCDWLSLYFDQPLDLKWEPGGLDMYITYGPDPSYARDELQHYCWSIYTSSDDFRYYIERLITMVILKDYGQITGDDLSKFSVSRLESARDEMQDELLHNDKPQFPTDLSSYDVLQKWASKYESYSIIEERYEDDIEYIEDELNSRFNPSRDTLYVCSGNPDCLIDHETKSITATVPGIDGRNHELNINYCVECRKYFIKLSEYERYQEKYHFVLARIERIDVGSRDVFFNRKEYSPLMLCGYSVAKSSGLKENDRRILLARLLDTHVFSKGEIISHLDMLINTNSKKANMREARLKWLSDLDFIRDHRINEQDRSFIDDIKPGSRNLRAAPQ